MDEQVKLHIYEMSELTALGKLSAARRALHEKRHCSGALVVRSSYKWVISKTWRKRKPREDVLAPEFLKLL